MIKQEHQIDRFQIRLKSSRRSVAAQQQQQLSYLLHTSGFLGQLESMLDRLTPGGEYLEIPALKVSFTCRDAATLPALLLAELERRLGETAAKRNDPAVLQLSSAAFRHKVLRDFILYGTAFHPGALVALQEMMRHIRALPATAHTEIEKVICELMPVSTVAARRIYGLVGEEGMRLLFYRLFNQSYSDLVAENEKAKDGSTVTNPPLGTAEFWATAFRKIQVTGNKQESTKTEITAKPKSSPVTRNSAPIQENVSKRISEKLDTASSIPVSNAGLILLWTLFSPLFRECGYIKDRSFVTSFTQQKALLLLQYLVTGTTECEEYDLPLNKILCAWPLEEPVAISLRPSPDDCRLADAAFEEFITAWRGGKKYSAEWFRTSFLQREGTLSFRADGNYKLIVHRKTEDILLSPMTVIRLPWMTNLIFVQW